MFSEAGSWTSTFASSNEQASVGSYEMMETTFSIRMEEQGDPQFDVSTTPEEAESITEDHQAPSSLRYSNNSQYYNYKNFSAVEDPNPNIPVTRSGRIPNFPAKVYTILGRPDFENIISWMPHGRSWKVHNRRDFETKVLPVYFQHSNFSSFVRQANGWGFRRAVNAKGMDRNSYYHELFLRGKPHLLKMMKRPVGHKKPLEADSGTAGEPDFYQIAASSCDEKKDRLPEKANLVQEYKGDVLQHFLGEHTRPFRYSPALKVNTTSGPPEVVAPPTNAAVKLVAYAPKNELNDSVQSHVPRNIFVTNDPQMASLEPRRTEILSFASSSSSNVANGGVGPQLQQQVVTSYPFYKNAGPAQTPGTLATTRTPETLFSREQQLRPSSSHTIFEAAYMDPLFCLLEKEGFRDPFAAGAGFIASEFYE